MYHSLSGHPAMDLQLVLSLLETVSILQERVGKPDISSEAEGVGNLAGHVALMVETPNHQVHRPLLNSGYPLAAPG